ncbi:hypothetical protein GCM10023321_15360 [Pseudonocardia eucalypti]|uniref:SH3 domain-containing protein n=1 Tax=Pseudonocardia eucalypti TaxID=648755 RepID=A0ABP9PQ50_9PSEU|nr:hypothetical protein [Pseudonocardia eucalypti]
MVKINLPKMPKAKSWPFAAGVSLILGVMVLIDKGAVSSTSGLSAPCRVEVTAEVNIRDSPEASGRNIGTLHRGDVRGTQPTVRNGYRDLGNGEWALDQFLRPLPGSTCTQ